MQETASLDVAHVIQLAVAPVFLVTGVASTLGVLTSRLGRIVDRARTLELLAPEAAGDAATRVHQDLAALSRRAKLINFAIGLCILCAAMVCALIATLFVDALSPLDLSILLAVIFVGAMLVFFAALLFFLREVLIATASVRIGPH